MPLARRFAVYFAPEQDSSLDRLGRGWLERDPRQPLLNLPAPLSGLDPVRRQELVFEPRHYGFHATLKPPMRLAPGLSRDRLAAAVAGLAGDRRPFVAPPLHLAELDGFLALRPVQAAPALDRLAEDCLRRFEPFRAPISADERAKRLRRPLTERQRVLLDQWGYPYVLDQYRFHMTLTGRIDQPEERRRVFELLRPLVAEVEGEPLAVSSVCLFEQSAPGQPFVLAERFPFAAE